MNLTTADRDELTAWLDEHGCAWDDTASTGDLRNVARFWRDDPKLDLQEWAEGE